MTSVLYQQKPRHAAMIPLGIKSQRLDKGQKLGKVRWLKQAKAVGSGSPSQQLQSIFGLSDAGGLPYPFQDKSATRLC